MCMSGEVLWWKLQTKGGGAALHTIDPATDTHPYLNQNTTQEIATPSIMAESKPPGKDRPVACLVCEVTNRLI